jgi:23S rRNA G2069 N7-methylase RlmK/C1962 C5-methylase RlmI
MPLLFYHRQLPAALPSISSKAAKNPCCVATLDLLKGIERVQGNPVDGDTVEIFTRRQMARPRCLVRQLPDPCRVWTFDKDESVDLDFFIRRLKYAQESRDGLIKRQGLTGIASAPPNPTACRV